MTAADTPRAENPINPDEDRSTIEGQATFWAQMERVLQADEARRRQREPQ